ncbi:radical SAM/SPASM family putative metalloenzyme maturase [Pseudodesulfovibrio sediminis]|uniref:Radical SAM protein n=1 Tax=Pseudodesulfovibrio sediminis TaxID=2810563 RepID=A0ABM7P4R0_9BACT|nr:radical SAM/SPASM family putative metalloenzyme maturase [Pseudodesulfovibrio sediminis]BCS87837.1 radical SAM protein [Pseudodesulfovibrio sediminis]
MTKCSTRSSQPFPARLQVEVTTRCNMRCSMCFKFAPDSEIPELDLDLATFKRLKPALEKCEALVLSGIGEPLLNPELADMAAFARQVMPENGWIGFQTNGLLMTEERADSLIRSGVDTFCISVDSLKPCTTESGELHGEVHVDRLVRTFDQLKVAGRTHGRALKLGVEFVLMADTVAQLPDVVRWAGEQECDFVIVSHVLVHDESLHAQSLFNPNPPSVTALFDEWQAKAQAEGLDMHDQEGLAWKFIKTPKQKRLSELVREFRATALKDGSWVHLGHLLEWDKRELSGANEAVRQICAKAEHLASELGIEMRMPPLMAQDERRCGFMEDSVAFVTSEGDVSPCQFLWHQYSCQLDGGKKIIKPWKFGNIREQDLGEIWRSEPYAGFREEALKYEYPYCSNCPFVPCDDITGTVYDFEYDCLGVTIPCGHCLWCMGGLQCLL